MRLNRQRRAIIHLEEGWTRIQNGGLNSFLQRVEACNETEMQRRPNPVNEMSEIIDIVFQMCIQREPNNYSEQVYNKVQETTRDYYVQFFLPALHESKMKSPYHFLDEMAKRYTQCQFTVGGMHRMFNYLNRYHVPNSDGLLLLQENGYHVFKTTVYDQFKVDLRDAILHFIEQERNDNIVNRDLLKNCVWIFVGLGHELRTAYSTGHNAEFGIYTQDFEDAMIRQTREYYAVASEKWLVQKSTPEYLSQIEKIQQDELNRIQSYLHPSTSEGKVMQTLRESLLKNPQNRILDQASGLIRMLDEEASEDLARLYRLYKDVDGGIKPIAESFKQYICSLGYGFIEKAKEQESNNKNQNQASTLNLIEKIIKLHERFHNHVTQDFQTDTQMSRALKEAFEEFINKTNYVVRYLAKYAHSFMIKGGPAEGLQNADKEEQLLHIQMIYGYIRDKDVFERDYQLYLSHRLLNNQSSSDAMEQKMIGLLKAICGYHWAQKLEDMFKDMQTSREVMKDFKRQYKNEFNTFDFDVNICEYGKWPEQVDQKKLGSIHPPDDLQNFFAALKQFYENKHPGRRFFVRWDKGTGEVMVTFNRKTKKRKTLLLKSTYQIMFLLCFNAKNSQGKAIWKYSEIKDRLGIPDAELKSAILPLLHPKLQIIQKRPGGKKIEPDHMMRLNAKFSNPVSRIAVPTFKPVKQVSDTAVPNEIAQQRKHQMDAAVVRIMKARRQLPVQELLGEVIQQLQARFQPDPKQIKKRIEVLLAQDYLERDEENRNLLYYKQ